jgi:hypothetical protein
VHLLRGGDHTLLSGTRTCRTEDGPAWGMIRMAVRRDRNNLPRRRPAVPERRARAWERAAAWIAGRRRSEQIGAGAAAACILALLVYLLIPAGPARAYEPQQRTRAYTGYGACLLTDEAGISAPSAAAVWAGMQRASGTTHEKISYLTMAGPDTEANAQTYIDTLALRGCDLVLGTGRLPDAAIAARAGAYPKLEFVATPQVVADGGSSAATAAPSASPSPDSIDSAPANVTRVPAGAATAVASSVRALLLKDYHAVG